MRWVQRCLAAGHYGFGLLLLVGAGASAAAGLGILPPGLAGLWLVLFSLGFSFLGGLVTFLLQAALAVWILVLARWLWAGHRRLRLPLLVTHGFVLTLGLLYLGIGFLAITAAERSTARGGGLLSPLAVLPFLHGVPLTILALCSIAFALAATNHDRQPLP